MKGRAIPYSSEELDWLSERREWPRAILHETFAMLFERQDVSPTALNGLMKRKGWMTGRSGCFAPGQEPPNKGKRCPEGVGGRHPNARRTQFKCGARSGRAAENYQPIGTERISEDGYRERKIHDGLPMQSRWRLVHLVEWEATNGPVPDGHCLKCLDGDRTNTDPANWIAIPRGVLPRLNGGRATRVMAYDTAPADLKPTILAMARVEQKARDVKKGRAA